MKAVVKVAKSGDSCTDMYQGVIITNTPREVEVSSFIEMMLGLKILTEVPAAALSNEEKPDGEENPDETEL